MKTINFFVFLDKFKVIEVASLDELANTEKWVGLLKNYDSVFLCLGARSNAPKVLLVIFQVKK